MVYVLQCRLIVNDLFFDLRDGHNLIPLLEVLSHETLVNSFKYLISINRNYLFP